MSSHGHQGTRLIVDSSVIQIENVMRQLAEDPSGRSRMDIVRDAVVEVRKPTMFGEFIIAIVYLPILTLEGIEGKLFRPLALTVIFALAGSMLLSLTLVPVLASLGLPRRVARRVYRPRHPEVWRDPRSGDKAATPRVVEIIAAD